MKRKILFLVVIALLVVVMPVSAKPKAPVGDRLFVWPGAQTTFPAGEGFHIKHGWLLIIPDEAPVGAWSFALEIDGVFVDNDYVSRQVVGHKPLLIEKYYVHNFSEGMTGTHTFTGHWYATCQALVHGGFLPGPCADRNEVVEYHVHSVTVDFLP
ncbi:MAG: hypothetical protein ABFS17_02840 [Chloroflexota bacterium]